MPKVRPTDEDVEASTSKFHTKGIEAFVTMAAKLFGAVSRKLERRQSTSSSDESIESGVVPNVHLPVYTQSSTRKLAFGTAATEEHKPLDDFYNNSTLTNFSKLFCAIVLIAAFLLVMSRSLQLAYDIDHWSWNSEAVVVTTPQPSDASFISQNTTNDAQNSVNSNQNQSLAIILSSDNYLNS